MVVLAIMI